MKPNYYEIVFLQGEEAEEVLAMIGDDGPRAAIDYLAQWDQGGESEHCLSESVDPPWGSGDSLHRSGHYILSWSHRLSYAGLTRRRRGVLSR